MEYYSAMTKNEILLFAATWMDPENIMFSEIRQRQILYDITYMWNLRSNTSECIYKTNRFTDVGNKFMVTGGERSGGKGQVRNMELTDTNYYT